MPPQQPIPPAPAAPPPIANPPERADEDMLEPDEHVLTVVHRSIIGLLGIYLVAALAVGAIVALIIVVSPSTFTVSGVNVAKMVTSIVSVAVILLGLILFMATHVYRRNRLMVTDKSLVQITQRTMFIRKVSRLSMSNVEDVSEEQRGVLPNLFNYGTLTVQTAGTEDNFIFTLCPDPAKLADRIIEARQAYARENSTPR